MVCIATKYTDIYAESISMNLNMIAISLNVDNPENTFKNVSTDNAVKFRSLSV